MSKTQTVKIKIWGIVQGVGFRPFVAKLADRFEMKGEVLNIGGLVDIIITDESERIDSFIEALKREKPIPAEIVHIKLEELEPREFDCFTILDSDDGDDEAAMIPADLSICPDCLAELQDKNNPRYMHPFISCMVCGPRYTIIDKIPYDRDNTAMIEFPMCDFCRSEYTDRNDRRYHAQTISCHDCGPMLKVKLTEEENEASSIGVIGVNPRPEILEKAVAPVARASILLHEGKIIALKGVGGYNLVCSPFLPDTVTALRKLKIREEKPFAVMFRDIEQIKEHCYVSGNEEKLLMSSAKPIVLLERKQDGKICEEVYRTSRFIGAFLPSMGVQFMLIDFSGPLIMTSANLSDMPIIKDEDKIFEFQKNAYSYFKSENLKEDTFAGVFYNERKIRMRLDDSVARVIDGQPQMIRRSKGYAPVPLYVNNHLTKKDMILATGGQLKASFSISKGPFAYVSQYFGDLDSKESCDIYEENVERLKELFRIKPNLIVCDLHPLYYTTKYAEIYANQHSLPLLKVQHHHAHVASVMAEHDLKGSVIGVSFDGTGYGTDGAIWGGEFLVCSNGEFSREAHLEYVKMLGGDSSMKEGWKSAMCYLYHYQDDNCESVFGTSNGELDDPEWFDDQRWPMVKAGLEHGINTIHSSSMGRLFDGVAAYAGIHDQNRYEGECAIMLENAAAEALKQGLTPVEMEFEIKETNQISARPIFLEIGKAMKAGIEKGQVALGFHYAVAVVIEKICLTLRETKGINQVALTGGVFQNKILMERTLKLLREENFQVYYNISVGPNDGGICLGQNYIGMKYLTKGGDENEK